MISKVLGVKELPKSLPKTWEDKEGATIVDLLVAVGSKPPEPDRRRKRDRRVR